MAVTLLWLLLLAWGALLPLYLWWRLRVTRGQAARWEAVALAAERLARAERDAALRHLRRRRREKRAAAAPASAGSGAPPREGEP